MFRGVDPTDFDTVQFIHDVHDFRRRNKLSSLKLAENAGVDRGLFYRPIRCISLFCAVRLAVYCDLSLDKYVIRKFENDSIGA